MITKFKIYEVRVQPRNSFERHYWLVPTKPIEKFRVALKKIGFDNPRNIEEWCKFMTEKYPISKEDKIYVIHILDADEYIVNDTWDWENINSFLPEKNDFYEGEVIVEDWEVAAEKYNL